MRNAEVKDQWRRLHTKKRRHRLSSVHLTREEFPRGAVLLDLPPLTVVCGGNGVGKTSVLTIIHAALTGDPSQLSSHLQEGRVELSVEENGELWYVTVDLSDINNRSTQRALPFPEIRWIDSSRESEAARSRFKAEPELEDLLAQFGNIEFTDDQLSLARYVTRKDFTRVAVTLVEAESSISGLDDDEPPAKGIPFFEVEESGIAYDSRTMGAGEIASLTILWCLFDTLPGSLVLIEEPETHVSPASQRQLLNAIAKLANDRYISVILSTHSVEMLHLTPPSCIRIAEPLDGVLGVRVPQSLNEVRNALGSTPQPAKLVIVEDRLAMVTLHELLAPSRILAALGADIAYAGSCEDAARTAALCAALTPPCAAVAVLDGDQRGRIDGCLFLPGNEPPEVVLLSAMTSKRRSLANKIGRSEADVSSALTSIRGQDCHEAWHEVWSRLNINSESLARAAVQVWLTMPGSKRAVRQLVAEISAVLGD